MIYQTTGCVDWLTYCLVDFAPTVIGRTNKTDQVVLQIIWDIPILLSANNRASCARKTAGIFNRDVPNHLQNFLIRLILSAYPCTIIILCNHTSDRIVRLALEGLQANTLTGGTFPKSNFSRNEIQERFSRWCSRNRPDGICKIFKYFQRRLIRFSLKDIGSLFKKVMDWMNCCYRRLYISGWLVDTRRFQLEIFTWTK